MCETNSISDEDFYGLSESIKIQPENKKFDYSKLYPYFCIHKVKK